MPQNLTCRQLPRRREGFTLLEMLLSISLFIVLVGILWNVVSIFSKAQTQGNRLAERSQLVRSLEQLLRDDLQAAIQDPIHPQLADLKGDDDIRRFGLSGSEQTLRIDVIEINPFAVQPEETARHAMMGEVRTSGPKAAELKTVFYDFTVASGLARREIDFETPDINAPGPEGSDMLAPEVVECRFRYFDGKSWSDTWESLDRGGLPVAIEATLTLLPLSEAIQLRQIRGGSTLEEALARSDFSVPVKSRVVSYLPTSPVRKFEEYKRPEPEKKDDYPELVMPAQEWPSVAMPAVLPEVPLPEIPLLPDLSEPPKPTETENTGPRQSWIRQGTP